MPKKAPAAAAGGEGKKAASPKTEKPVDGAPAEKKPAQQKNQPKQGKDAAGGDHAPRTHKDNAAQHHREGAASSPAGEKRNFTLSEDPEEAGIQKKLNAIDDEISAHRASIDKITLSIDQKMAAKKKLIAEKQELRGQNKGEAGAEGGGKQTNFKAKREEVFEKLKEARRQKSLKVNEIKEMRKNLAGAADEKNYLKNLDDKIKELEDRQAGSSLPLAEEKKIIAEIGKLQNSKKFYKSYTDLNESIKQFDTSIAGLEVDLGKIKEEADVFFSKKNAERDLFAASDSKIDAVQDEIAKEQATRSGLYDKITELRTQQTTVKNDLKEFRDKKRESRQAEYERTKQERQAEYDRQKQQRQAENQRRADEKKAKELKRIQEELKEEPYSEELELCIQLIKYLEPFVPKVPKAAVEGETGSDSPKPAATTPPPLRADNAPEGIPLVREEEDTRPLSKRGKKKPQKPVDLEKELRHNVETFLQFEKVSIVPPAKIGEVEKTVSTLKDKKVYYQKRAEEKLLKRKAELEAEAKAIHNPQSTTTTTTSTSEESKETSEETTPADE